MRLTTIMGLVSWSYLLPALAVGTLLSALVEP